MYCFVVNYVQMCKTIVLEILKYLIIIKVLNHITTQNQNKTIIQMKNYTYNKILYFYSFTYFVCYTNILYL
ncbi:hypothetical protein C923_02750 [Plasmodium falciparum UGT5.1]|uniref:Transmembrane protein n=1 Tax=Plasmodium falciparum UGT5.1 TaxID=1237627 RepID=W7JNH6_PLAFA|nr:hypothetical protein C923_02750 [Plasmodium falciparum UGT5.1]